MYFNFYYLFLLLRKYIKQKNMRLLLTFIIFILGGFYTFGKESCCEQCCECLGNCCKKGKEEVKNGNNVEEEEEEEEEEEVKEKFYLKKSEATDPEEIKKLVNTDWYEAKKETASFFLYEKIDNIENGGLNDNNVIKVKKYKNGFSIDKDFITEEDNTKKWALFEIIYKEEKGEEWKTVYLYCSDIESTEGIFDSCEQYISVSVIACNTSNVTSMFSMFSGCSSLQQLDLKNFKTDNVENMGFMFSDCKSLTKLDLSNFNTKTVTDMSSMFSDCSYLQELDLSKFDTKNVTNMANMFSGCSSLTKLDLPNFNTGNVEKMDNMFSECNSLRTVTFNKNLNENIIKQLNKLGLTDEVEEGEGNKITFGKKPQT